MSALEVVCTLFITLYQTSGAQEISSCIASNTVVHNWNVQDNLLDKGWTNCLFEQYSNMITIDDILSSCPNETDYYLFVGALTSSASQTALLGAYAPASVLSTEFITNRGLSVPIGYEFTAYNVSWYNYVDGPYCFGFSSAPNVQLGLKGASGLWATSGDVSDEPIIEDRLSLSLRDNIYITLEVTELVRQWNYNEMMFIKK